MWHQKVGNFEVGCLFFVVITLLGNKSYTAGKTNKTVSSKMVLFVRKMHLMIEQQAESQSVVDVHPKIPF